MPAMATDGDDFQIKVVDELPPRRTGGGNAGKYHDILSVVRDEHPGKWISIWEGRMALASSRAAGLRQGQMRIPKGDWNFEARRVPAPEGSTADSLGYDPDHHASLFAKYNGPEKAVLVSEEELAAVAGPPEQPVGPEAFPTQPGEAVPATWDGENAEHVAEADQHDGTVSVPAPAADLFEAPEAPGHATVVEQPVSSEPIVYEQPADTLEGAVLANRQPQPPSGEFLEGIGLGADEDPAVHVEEVDGVRVISVQQPEGPLPEGLEDLDLS